MTHGPDPEQIVVAGEKTARQHGRPPPRLFVSSDLRCDLPVPLDSGQNNYLANVLRLKHGASVLAFNGRDGEWLCALREAGRRHLILEAKEQVRPQPEAGDLHYLFAPLKSARLDYMVQKAVEMGVSHLAPVLTRRTQVSRINTARLQANAIEAAEQCGILTLPGIGAELKLEQAIAAMAPERLLIFCDEAAPANKPPGDRDASAMPGVQEFAGFPRGQPMALLVGPEGGFDDQERRFLLSRPRVLRLSLGPRILRADTAAVAALAIVQSRLGDWA